MLETRIFVLLWAVQKFSTFRYIKVWYYNLKIDCSSKFEENFVSAVLYAQLIQNLPRIIKFDEKTSIFIFLGYTTVSWTDWTLASLEK